MKFMQIFKMPNIFVHDRIIEKFFFVSCKTNVDDDWEVHIVHPDNRYFLFFKVSKDFCEFRMFLCCVDDFVSLCMSSFVSRCIFFCKNRWSRVLTCLLLSQLEWFMSCLETTICCLVAFVCGLLWAMKNA